VAEHHGANGQRSKAVKAGNSVGGGLACWF